MEGKKGYRGSNVLSQNKADVGNNSCPALGVGSETSAEDCNEANKYNGIIETFVIKAISGQNPTNS